MVDKTLIYRGVCENCEVKHEDVSKCRYKDTPFSQIIHECHCATALRKDGKQHEVTEVILTLYKIVYV